MISSQQFPNYTFEQANPGMTGAASAMDLLQKALNTAYAPKVSEQELLAKHLANQFSQAALPYAGPMAKAELEGKLSANALAPVEKQYKEALLQEALFKLKHPELSAPGDVGQDAWARFADSLQGGGGGAGRSGGAASPPNNIPQNLPAPAQNIQSILRAALSNQQQPNVGMPAPTPGYEQLADILGQARGQYAQLPTEGQFNVNPERLQQNTQGIPMQVAESQVSKLAQGVSQIPGAAISTSSQQAVEHPITALAKDVAANPNSYSAKLAERLNEKRLNDKTLREYRQSQMEAGSFKTTPAMQRANDIGQARTMGYDPTEAEQLLYHGKTLGDSAEAKAQELGLTKEEAKAQGLTRDPRDWKAPTKPLTTVNETKKQQAYVFRQATRSLTPFITQAQKKFERRVLGTNIPYEFLKKHTPEEVGDYLAARVLGTDRTILQLKGGGVNVGENAIKDLNRKSMVDDANVSFYKFGKDAPAIREWMDKRIDQQLGILSAAELKAYDDYAAGRLTTEAPEEKNTANALNHIFGGQQ